jgi:peptidoglycan/xylan/chitin deacetylase (PgdA/CDA1 family)
VSATGTCVLTMHRVRAERERDHDLSRSSFDCLLQLLDRAGRPSHDDIAQPAPGCVVLTFDDGTDDHLELAMRLADAGIRAIFFVSTERLGRDGYLTTEGVQALGRYGHHVGSHAVHHVRLESLSAGELRRELEDSKRQLDSLLAKPVTLFAAPGGSRHRALARELAAAGYEAARSSRWGIYRDATARWEVPSLPVTELTIQNGWIERALRAWRVPTAMQWTWAARKLAPPSIARHARRRLHARFD